MRKLKTIEKKISTILDVDLFAKTRRLPNVDARSLYIYVLKEYMGMTYEEIAEYMYKKGWSTNNHTLVRYNHLLFDEVRKRRPEMETILEAVLSKTDPLYYKKELMNLIDGVEDKKTITNIYNYARKKADKFTRESQVQVCENV